MAENLGGPTPQKITNPLSIVYRGYLRFFNFNLAPSFGLSNLFRQHSCSYQELHLRFKSMYFYYDDIKADEFVFIFDSFLRHGGAPTS